MPRVRWTTRGRLGARWLKRRWRRTFPARITAWAGPVANAGGGSEIVTRDADRIRIVATFVGSIRQEIAGGSLSGSALGLDVVISGWTTPWPGWHGQLGWVPGLTHSDIRLPDSGHGSAAVSLTVAAPLPARLLAEAAAHVLAPWHPLPETLSADVVIEAGSTWLRSDNVVDVADHANLTDAVIRPYDLLVAASARTTPGFGVTLVGSAYGAVDGHNDAIVVDATTANPRGRQRYRPELPTGTLALVTGADATWWQVGPGDGNSAIVATGRIGDPLDERHISALAQLGAVEVAAAPAGVPAQAHASVIAQLAMTGLVLHAPDLEAATGRLVADDLLALLRTPLPAADADPIDNELRSVAQRRSALRGHGAAFAGTSALAGVSTLLRRPPLVTALLVTRRPAYVAETIRAMRAQTYPELEVVVGLHGVDLAPAERARLDDLELPIRVESLPAELNLGEALGVATRLASGSLITKVDDDDRYGPEHIWDLVLARHFSGATVVGKGAEFVHVTSRDVTVRRRMGSELYTDVVAGGTMLLSRGDLEDVGGWRPVVRSVDRGLLDRVLRRGGLVYRTHGFGFIYTRHTDGHTWDPGVDYFLRDPLRTWSGLPPYPEFGAA